MDVVDIIRAKRDGERLTDDQIDWFVAEFSRGGTIPDDTLPPSIRVLHAEQADETVP